MKLALLSFVIVSFLATIAWAEDDYVPPPTPAGDSPAAAEEQGLSPPINDTFRENGGHPPDAEPGAPI